MGHLLLSSLGTITSKVSMCDVGEPELGNLYDKWQQGLNEWREEVEDVNDSGHGCLLCENADVETVPYTGLRTHYVQDGDIQVLGLLNSYAPQPPLSFLWVARSFALTLRGSPAWLPGGSPDVLS